MGGVRLLPHLVWYLLASYIRSYRYFPPLLVFQIGLMLLYANRPNPVMDSYAASSVLVYAVSAWIGAGFHGAIADAQEHIAAVHAGSVRAYLTGKALAALACGLLLSVAAVAWPAASGSFERSPGAGEWLTALLAHAEMSLLGGLAALLLSHPVLKKGTRASAALLLVLILSIARNGVLREIGDGFAPLFWLLPPAAPLVDWMTAPDKAPDMNGAAVWVWPLAYGGALWWLYMRLAERRM